MKYPRLPREKYNKKILLPSEIKQLRDFFEEYQNIRLTARTFNVSRHTVKYHTDEKYKKRKSAYSSERNYNKYHKDDEYRDMFKKRAVTNCRALRIKHPAIVKYGIARKQDRYHKDPIVRQQVSITKKIR